MSDSLQEQLSKLREQVDRRDLVNKAIDKQVQDLEYLIRERQREKMLKDKLDRLTGVTDA